MTRVATGTLSSAAEGAVTLITPIVAVAIKEARNCKFPTLADPLTGRASPIG
ncbi:hypothetical protein GCM10022253_04450 [Sphingomonas endophytica]